MRNLRNLRICGKTAEPSSTKHWHDYYEQVKQFEFSRSMTVKAQIKEHIASLPDAQRADMQTLHELAVKLSPKSKLWFLDGKNEQGKQVTNPNIGYGEQTMQLAGGKTRAFYRVGFAAGKSGISVYIIGLADKKHLQNAYGKKIGKAKVTGYCIAFKTLKDIKIEVLKEAIRFGLMASE